MDDTQLSQIFKNMGEGTIQADYLRRRKIKMDTGRLWAVRMRFVAISFLIIFLTACSSQYETKRINCIKFDRCVHREKTYEYREARSSSATGIAATGVGIIAATIPPAGGFDFGPTNPYNTVNSNLRKAYPECRGFGGDDYWKELFNCVKRIDIKEGRLKVVDP